MAAYLIADIDITDAAVFEEYSEKFLLPSVADIWGVAGYPSALKRLKAASSCYLRVPRRSFAESWYNSPKYSRLKVVRGRCPKTRIKALEGHSLNSDGPMQTRARAATAPCWEIRPLIICRATKVEEWNFKCVGEGWLDMASTAPVNISFAKTRVEGNRNHEELQNSRHSPAWPDSS